MTFVTVSCSEPPGVEDGAVPDAGAEAGLPDARSDAGRDADVDAEVSPDASPYVRPDPVQHGFCGDPVFKFIDGTVDRSDDMNLWGDRVAFFIDDPINPLHSPVKYLDAITCLEQEVTRDHVYSLTLYETTLFYSRVQTNTMMSLFQLDLVNWQEQQLTSDDIGHSDVRYNGRQMVFKETVWVNGNPSSWRIMLMDLPTGDTTELAPFSSQPAYPALTDRYAVWEQYTADPQSTGRDVFFHDLQTGITHHVDASYAGYQYDLAAAGHHVVWFGSDTYTSPPYHLMLHDLETGDSTLLLDDERGPPIAWMHGTLVAYTTTRYRTDTLITNRPADVELYDLATGVSRRFTTRPSNLRANAIFHPWLLIVDVLGANPNMNDWYLAHLQRLGVTDADGHLLPGDPVFEPPGAP